MGPVASGQGGGLIAVFGSAGERDVQKRPIMGRIAGERCRLVVVTDEDPRGEDGQKILDEIAAGAEAAGRRRGEDLFCIADRREAIATACERARAGDVVLLAGKGHEQSIIMKDGPRDWDERSEAIRALESLGYRSR
jgi:UDP-N-acetylmuramoyl-L-alanyl-D-glutamate--2,6-diaminopimelate ligase